MFFLAEYVNMVTVSAVATNLFLGGWHGPFLPAVARLGLVPRQGVGAPLLLSVAALDAAAVPVRPADVVRLEGAAAARGAQPARDGGGGDLLWALTLALLPVRRLAVVASLLVIGQRNPIYSVLLLIASFCALAGLYVLLDAPFIAVTQIIVYAGAIMVLFLFVVMLLNVPREDAATTVAPANRRAAALRRGAGGGARRGAGVGGLARVRAARRRGRTTAAGRR